MNRLAELLNLYLETEDREKLDENIYNVFANRMKSIRDSSLDLEEFVKLSECYNNLYQIEHDFVQLLMTNQKLEDIKNDFKFNEREIREVYEKHSKDLYEQEYKTKTNEKTDKKASNTTKSNINDNKSTTNKEKKDINQNHKCSCGGNCSSKKKSEEKRGKTLEDVIKELSEEKRGKTLEDVIKDLSEEFKDTKTTSETGKMSGKDLDKVFLNIFQVLNDPKQQVSKERAENIIEEIIKDIFGE